MKNWLHKIYFNKLQKALDHIEFGAITLTTPEGAKHHFSGKKPGAIAELILLDWRVIPALAAKGDIGLTITYRNGWWHSSSLVNLFTFVMDNYAALATWTHGNWISQISSRMLYSLRENSIEGSQRNIPAHYDLSNQFYQLWLDESMTYSSALFQSDQDSLHSAQLNKYDRLIERLTRPSGNVLEIGCGWGGFAERAIDQCDINVTGLTLSPAQQKFAAERLSHQKQQAQIQLRDYRQQSGKFDNIVSIEMFEAVGEKYWNTYFNKIKSLLAHNGRAQIQTITIEESRFDAYKKRGDMFRTFIFPGGMLPSVERFQKVAQQSELKVAKVFDFGQHYATTCEHWLLKFENNIDQVKKLGFDDAFIKTWRFYLSACIAGFKAKRTSVIQAELCHA